MEVSVKQQLLPKKISPKHEVKWYSLDIKALTSINYEITPSRSSCCPKHPRVNANTWLQNPTLPAHKNNTHSLLRQIRCKGQPVKCVTGHAI